MRRSEEKLQPAQQETARARSGMFGAFAGAFPHGTVVRAFLFATALGLIYISMRNYYVSLWRTAQALSEEVTNLHYEAITTQAELMRLGSASEVARLVQEHGLELETSKHPPTKIQLVTP